MTELYGVQFFHPPYSPYSGVMLGCTNPAMLQMLGVQSLSEDFSLVSALRGLAALLGPPMAGLLVDLSHQPILVINMSSGVLVFSVIMAFITLGMDARYNRRHQQYIQYRQIE